MSHKSVVIMEYLIHKIRKIKRGLLKRLRKLICSILGHKTMIIIEKRKRSNGRRVIGAYDCCERCNKKLSNFTRVFGITEQEFDEEYKQRKKQKTHGK